MATTDERGDAMDVEMSPKNKTSVEHDIHQTLGAISNSVEPLDMRADPDAQATVTDFLDFTEYLPSDMMRSLTLIGKLDQTHHEASLNVHNLTSTWGKLPSLPAEERPSPVQLRTDISNSLNHAVSSRVYAHAEAVRMSENVNRHYNRAKTILAKLKDMLENYPAEEQKSPVATSKSPQLVRAPRVMRNGAGEKMRRPQIPRITVPGEVLPPYDQFVAYSDDSDESSEEEDDESVVGRTPARATPAPRIKVVKTPKARPPKTPKPSGSARPQKAAPTPSTTTNTTTTPAVPLQPPPENAVIGSSDAPWLQLTSWELARLRKRMKKNATWNPSDTMILRELKTLGRGIDAYREAKKKAEDEGRVFDQVPPALAPDAESSNKPIPEGAISAAALASDDIQLSNRGMKLNEAKKLKRESLAKQAAEEAEESARQFREAARLLMSHEAPPSVANNAPDQPKAANKSNSKAKPKANGKRKRDSVPEAEAEKPEQAETPAPRPAPKRTKTETPIPLPHLRAGLASQTLNETPIPPPVLTPGGSAATPKTTTPVPIPTPGQETTAAGSATIAKPAITSAPASSPTGSTGAAPSFPSAAPANLVIKAGPETPIPPPVLSPKKSTTPILPPTREPAIKRETRGENTKKTQQQTENPTPALPSQLPQTQQPQAQRSSSAAPSIKQSSSRAATPGTTPVPDGQGRRPGSRGKAMSQEPQPSLAADRPRRASTARNTPAPELRQPSKRTRKPVPGIVSKTNAGGSSAVGKRKAAPKKKRAQKKEKGQPIEIELEEDDEGNPIDPNEPRYCDCNRVSFGEMIACDNDNCDKEWFHLECLGMTHIPARTTKWYCPDCRVRLNIGEKGEINARGVKA
ncbi:Inhibitor of growth protein 1 [Colletotrichum chlorophyti]|uniref:Inhibitor of growth protein 1 n=1 Tax=Colletotrichum chlorophyti TaxID=708187 RepID=A0A1Q8S0A3_9PEZI|nr:Inhibitor of growth protein 1 [Colletotrichum chlorophyti]